MQADIQGEKTQGVFRRTLSCVGPGLEKHALVKLCAVVGAGKRQDMLRARFCYRSMPICEKIKYSKVLGFQSQ